MITIYEYLCYTNPYVIFKLHRAGLLKENEDDKHEEAKIIKITRREIIQLMRHDKYKRIGRYIHQIGWAGK
ncbi:MAG: hypothetical protein ACPLRZ_07730 [Thermovenabulum sp.]|uniref:hypothetical protein n=1 Tax=Thermovenabulum sp. TaxID=3100335 RepID=UPI003C79C2A0